MNHQLLILVNRTNIMGSVCSIPNTLSLCIVTSVVVGIWGTLKHLLIYLFPLHCSVKTDVGREAKNKNESFMPNKKSRICVWSFLCCCPELFIWSHVWPSTLSHHSHKSHPSLHNVGLWWHWFHMSPHHKTLRNL